MTENNEHVSAEQLRSPEEQVHGEQVPEDLARCAMVVEHAIEHLKNEKFPPIAIASALLGGALGVLARSMEPEMILRILDSAAQSVRAGEVHASAAVAEREEQAETP